MRGILLASAAVSTVAVLLLMPLPAAWNGAWQGHFQDLGHVPLFAALTIALHFARGRGLHWNVLASVILAGMAELLQELVGRSGSGLDFLRGLLGSLAGALLVRAWQDRRFAKRLVVYFLGILILIAWPVVESAPYLIDAAEGHRDFPILAAFKTDRELARWEPWQATFTPTDGGGRLVMFPGPQTYPCASLRPVKRDFRGYRWLCWEFTTEGEPYELFLSMRTGAANDSTTHMDVGRRYAPGPQLVRLDLEVIGPKADPVPLDLSDVRYVQFFVIRPAKPRTIVIHRIWLE